MVSVSPHTSPTNAVTYLRERSASGYLNGRERVYGLGFTHLSGAACPEFGAPVIGPARAVTGSGDDYVTTLGEQVAFPGYYAADLPDLGALVEATATERTGLLRVHFDAGEAPHILVDVGRSLSWMGRAGDVHVVSPREIEGRVAFGGYCASGNGGDVYFVARVDRAPAATGTWQDGGVRSDPRAEGSAGAFWRFPRGTRVVTVRVGVSYVDIEGARANLDAESEGREFDAVREESVDIWEQALGRIRVEGGRAEDHTRFYTALYHAMIHPSLASDVDGRYRRFPDRVVATSSERRHHVFSLWDTYRTLHPLLALVWPAQQQDFARTLVDMTIAAGEPPLWEIGGQESHLMVGDPVAIVLWETWARGLRDFDLASVYPVLRAAAMTEGASAYRPGLAPYASLGYVPMDLDGSLWGPVSTTLEYAHADHALARLAEQLGEDADAATLDARSIGYRALYDAASGMIRPRYADGSFLDPFDPDRFDGSLGTLGSGGPGYVEGTASEYSFMVPHDILGLADLMGGEVVARDALAGILLAGRFSAANEPSLAYPFLLSRLGGAATGQRFTRELLDEAYGVGPGGLPGNDDTGTLSAFFVLAAMGLYPDLPGAADYALSAPLFERVTITLDPDFYPGGSFVIETSGPLSGSAFVAEAELDGEPVSVARVAHAAVTAGGTLRLRCSP